MREVKLAHAFLRDVKRERRDRHGRMLDALVMPVVEALATDTPLEVRYRDHPLVGNLAGCRDCHIKPDQTRFGADIRQTRQAQPAFAALGFACKTVPVNNTLKDPPKSIW